MAGQNNKTSLSLADKIEMLNKSQSLDSKYGVYDTLSAAMAVMASYGLDGRLFAVYTDKANGKVKVRIYNETLNSSSGLTRDEDVVFVGTIPEGVTTTLTAPAQTNLYVYSGASTKNVVLPSPNQFNGREIVIVSKGDGIVRVHSHDDSPIILDINAGEFGPQAIIASKNKGGLTTDGSSVFFDTVNSFASIAQEGKTIVVTVLPDGSLQGEEIQDLWTYDDTVTGYDLAGLQSAYPTSAGYLQGFEVRCRNTTPPTVYRKDSENDSIWTKIELTNVT
jgi:hypothetical protein